MGHVEEVLKLIALEMLTQGLGVKRAEPGPAAILLRPTSPHHRISLRVRKKAYRNALKVL